MTSDMGRQPHQIVYDGKRHRNPLLSQRLSRSFHRRCLHSLANPAHRLVGFAKLVPQPTAEHTSLSVFSFTQHRLGKAQFSSKELSIIFVTLIGQHRQDSNIAFV
nr:hypothetical protein CFP56_40355 [Quercus suber]